MQCNGAGKPGVRCIVILNEARLATTQYLRCDGSNGSVAGADYSDKRPYILYYSVYDCTRLMLRCPAYNETLYCCFFHEIQKRRQEKKFLSFRILEFTMHWLFFHEENAFTRASKLFYEKFNRRVPREWIEFK
ncbi:hypothetical protein V1477_006794 [Vespula maculifrons]|uniref:Uncharacterized protein n=1 Tax=Vespula maculifrons TaxID=7453 RepID=A0ABD2CGN7_VESMC